ncbi:MAG: flagellar assembly peptidoglycan hydrolase FlgJ, partial [Gammaproteobacteria bacterium]
EGVFDNDQTRFFMDMHDQQLALHLANEGGIGLADLIVKQMQGSRTPGADKTTLDAYLKQAVDPVAYEARRQSVTERPKTATEFKKDGGRPITSSEQFVEQLYGEAERAAAQLGVEPKLLLAQAALETGWGRSVINKQDGGGSFNLFNIKAGASWQGDRVQVATLEFDHGVADKQTASFRSYASFRESFDDYVHLLKNNPRYSRALEHAGDPERYLNELQQAGYATDPAYAEKIMAVFRSEPVSGYDPAETVAMNSR